MKYAGGIFLPGLSLHVYYPMVLRKWFHGDSSPFEKELGPVETHPLECSGVTVTADSDQQGDRWQTSAASALGCGRLVAISAVGSADVRMIMLRADGQCDWVGNQADVMVNIYDGLRGPQQPTCLLFRPKFPAEARTRLLPQYSSQPCLILSTTHFIPPLIHMAQNTPSNKASTLFHFTRHLTSSPPTPISLNWNWILASRLSTKFSFSSLP